MKINKNLQLLQTNIWTQMEKKLKYCWAYLWTAGTKWLQIQYSKQHIQANPMQQSPSSKQNSQSGGQMVKQVIFFHYAQICISYFTKASQHIIYSMWFSAVTYITCLSGKDLGSQTKL
jgi:hypothetical protein